VCDPDGSLGIDLLEGISALVDQSLVRQEAGEGEPRFTMLETIREFAGERLREVDPDGRVAAAHARYFLEVARSAAPLLTTADAAPHLDRLARDHDNFRAAVAWAAGRAEAGGPGAREGAELWWELLFALWRFWQIRGHLLEAARRIEHALRLPADAASAASRARLLQAAGGVSYWRGDIPGSAGYYEDALAIWRDLGDEREIANALYNRAFPYLFDRLDLDAARRLFGEARTIAERMGDRRFLALVLFGAGTVEYYSGEFEVALDTYRTGARIAESLGDRFNHAWSLHMGGLAADKAGDRRLARRLWREAIQLFAEASDATGIAILLTDFALAALWDGDRDRALRLRGASVALERASGADLAAVLLDLEGSLGLPLPAPEDDAERGAWAEGEQMNQEEAIAYALASTSR
jgi:tetratricopeptide (TPR) repeat protein